MTGAGRVCPNGHSAVLADQRFCETCGAAFALPAGAPPAPAAGSLPGGGPSAPAPGPRPPAHPGRPNHPVPFKRREVGADRVVGQIQRLGQLFVRNCAGADQDLPDPYAVIEEVGTDQVSLMEHQLTLPFFAGEMQDTGFPDPVQQLDDIDYRKMFQIAAK